MKKNDIFEVNIEKTSSDGRGIGYADGKICFVLGTLEGETVKAKVYTVHNSYITAGAQEIITPSPYRQYGYCNKINTCGGCPLSHIQYSHQLKIKRAHVVDTLYKIGKIENVRFVESTEAKIFSGKGAGGRDVYATTILGENAYGTTEISGGGLVHIIKQLGSGGTADPLDQRATAGWKATKAAVRLVEPYMVRIETASTFTS